MTAIDLIILNFEEVRRRSIKIWRGIPDNYLDWKPDQEAMSIKEMIRHVLESEHYYHLAILNRGSLQDYESPYEKRPFTNVEDELEFAQEYRKKFLETVKSFKPNDLENIKIDRSDVGYVRTLGDFLLRIAYHESVHAGQILGYLRTAGVARPDVWD
jgi:uncharacterized damage-inducible protein DinB